MGFSQGSLIGRYLIEECDLGPYKVHNYLSVGGPQMGVQRTPHCFTGIFCDILNDIEADIVYFKAAQALVAPAGYFRETTSTRRYNRYLKYCQFLPQLSNEIQHSKSGQYKAKFSSLNRLGLIQFQNDTVLFPRETAWFEELNDKGQMVKMRDTKFYQDDLLGLKTLDEANKVT